MRYVLIIKIMIIIDVILYYTIKKPLVKEKDRELALSSQAVSTVIKVVSLLPLFFFCKG